MITLMHSEIIKEQLTAPKIYLNGSTYSVVCELMCGKTLETQFFEDFFIWVEWRSLRILFIHFIMKIMWDMENMEIQQIFSLHASLEKFL